MEYGRSIPKVTEAVRKRVIKRVENLTGLEVTEVNIQVNDVILPELCSGRSAHLRLQPPLVSTPPRPCGRRLSALQQVV